MTRRFTILMLVLYAIAISIGGLALVAATATPARSQTLCGPLPDLLNAFRRKYKEQVIWSGESLSGRYLIIASGDGSWTMIHVGKSGEPACILATEKKNVTDRGT